MPKLKCEVLDGLKTSRALRTCSGAMVLFSSLLQTSLDSDEIRLINSANAQTIECKVQ